MTDLSTLTCEQAIFTSIRSPMGEGYRIIAASKGLRPDEKQTITRFSPSHDGLCRPPAGALEPQDMTGFAYYPLPSGRLCVAVSCPAGAEHTGRGGQRIYTQTVVFDPASFAAWDFNPFHVFRAMQKTGLTQPRLKLPAVLPDLLLPRGTECHAADHPHLHAALQTPHRLYALEQLLEQKPLALCLDDGWIASAEALLLGVPGPLRAARSLSAGLTFSSGRCQVLNLVGDPNGQARARAACHRVAFLTPPESPPALSRQSAWLTFVERHFENEDFDGLSLRTSRHLPDSGPVARERVARLYNILDVMPRLSVLDTLGSAESLLGQTEGHPDGNLLNDTLRRLGERADTLITGLGLDGLQNVWRGTLQLWKHGTTQRTWAQRRVEAVLRALLRVDAHTAAVSALGLVSDLGPAGAGTETQGFLDAMLGELAHKLTCMQPHHRARWGEVVERWRAVHPTHPAIEQLTHLVEEGQSPRQAAASPAR